MKKIKFQYIYYNDFLSIAVLNRGKMRTWLEYGAWMWLKSWNEERENGECDHQFNYEEINKTLKDFKQNDIENPPFEW